MQKQVQSKTKRKQKSKHKRQRYRFLSFILMALLLCQSFGGFISRAEEATMDKIECIAAEGTLKGVSEEKGKPGVGPFYEEGDRAEVSFEIPETGYYQIQVDYFLPQEAGHKINTVLLDGTYLAQPKFLPGDGVLTMDLLTVKLTEGEHRLALTKGENDWGSMRLVAFTLEKTEKEERSYEVVEDLIDPEATPEAQRLYAYLRSIYGKKVLSGQQMYVTEEPEIDKIEEHTGELPAVKGYDFMNQMPDGYIDDEIERALDWVEQGGIVTLCWHWWAPMGGRAFYTNDTDFDIREAVKEGTPEHELILRDIEIVAKQLLEFQAAKKPVIFRPLHEASGGWFWWGAHGPEPYKALWDLLYDQIVNVYGVHNLIWVANVQDPEWFVGNDKCDIIGEDIYPGKHVEASHVMRFNEAYDTVDGQKIVALTENGALPDIDKMQEEDAMWAWFMPWYGEFTTTDEHTRDEHFKAVYQHPDVINFQDLPEDLYDVSGEDFMRDDARTKSDEKTNAKEDEKTNAETDDIDVFALTEAMQPGWNLGNTFDATQGETSWGNPKVTRELIAAIRAEGFNSFRLPVTWGHAVGEAPDYTIDPAYMARVQEVLDWCLEEGLIVMLNMHHDSDDFYDLPERPELLNRFRRIWEQIAENFKDYPADRVLFEAINEPRFSEDWEAAEQAHLDATDAMNNTAYEVIRASGGENAIRPIVFETLTAGINSRKLEALQANLLAKDDPNLIGSVHYYGYWPFSVNNSGKTRFDAEVEGHIEQNLDMVQSYIIDQGFPVILGEYGLLGYDQSVEVIERGESQKFFNALTKACEERGIPAILWDNGQHFEREKLYWRDPGLHAAIMGGFNGGSATAELDMIFMPEGTKEPAHLELDLAGHNLEDVLDLTHETSLSTDLYTLEGNTLTFDPSIQELCEERVLPLQLVFSAGAAWDVEIRLVSEPIFEDIDIRTVSLTIPVQWNGHKLERVKAITASGEAISSNWNAPYLTFFDEYKIDPETGAVTILTPKMTQLRDETLELTFELWNGDHYRYDVEIAEGSKVGKQVD